MKRNTVETGLVGMLGMLDQSWERMFITQGIWVLALDPTFAWHWVQFACEKEKLVPLHLPGEPSHSLHSALQTLSLHSCISAREHISVHNQPCYIPFTPHGEIKCISNWLSNKY